MDEWRQEAERLEQADRLDEASDLLAQILEAKPNYPPALLQDALLAFKRKQMTRAIRHMERLVELLPDEVRHRRNLSEIYRMNSRLDEALAQSRHALTLEPDSADSHYNLSLIHYDRQEIDTAIGFARRAVELDPDMATAHFELAENLLLSGQFAEGWEEYEWRFRMPNARPTLPPNELPQWDGRPLPDGALLLAADQGFGDAIQFCRYIPQVLERCPNVSVACSDEMHSVIRQQPGVREYFSRWDDLRVFDAQCPLSGLPRIFGTTLETIPAPVPYLRAQPGRLAYWRDRLEALTPRGYRRIGLVWAGRPTHGNDYNRSMPLRALAPLARLDATVLVSLQMGPGKDQISDYYGAAPLINLGAEINDYDDTMAILDCLDHLVSVDSSVAHLAGAMGRPVSILVPFAPDWRWLTKRPDTPWYPTAILHRQIAPARWEEPLASVVKLLKSCPRTPR